MSGSDAGNSRERLSVMCKTQSGFKIAEEDLKLRGPGDFFGERQHGLPEMRIASLTNSYDTEVLKKAQEDSDGLLKSDPELRAPENTLLRRRIERLFDAGFSSFN